MASVVTAIVAVSLRVAMAWEFTVFRLTNRNYRPNILTVPNKRWDEPLLSFSKIRNR